MACEASSERKQRLDPCSCHCALPAGNRVCGLAVTITGTSAIPTQSYYGGGRTVERSAGLPSCRRTAQHELADLRAALTPGVVALQLACSAHFPPSPIHVRAVHIKAQEQVAIQEEGDDKLPRRETRSRRSPITPRHCSRYPPPPPPPPCVKVHT